MIRNACSSVGLWWIPLLLLAGILAAVIPGARPAVAAPHHDAATLEPLDGITVVAAGRNHTCALTAAGGVKCWGQNQKGQLGDGTTINRTVPVDVSGLTSGIIAITAGDEHNCALTSDGGVKCWGNNDNGQIGDGSMVNRLTPVKVTGLSSGVTTIVGGRGHSCAVHNGSVKCWGENADGGLGDGTTVDRTQPVATGGGLASIVQLAAGAGHTCALSEGGVVHCWGRNGDGQIGDNTTIERLSPVQITALGSTIVEISAEFNHTCALTGSGALKCWGMNGNGQIGDGSKTDRLTPVTPVGLASGVASIGTIGDYHSCARTTAGGVKCWGGNTYGQVGDGSTNERTTPVDVSGLTSGVAAVAAGDYHTCAVLDDSTLRCWGRNDFGQLGNNKSVSVSAPVTVLDQFLCSSVSEIPQSECAALQDLYTATDPTKWSNATGWLESNAPCTWHGVTCAGGHVTKLELAENGLNGQLPASIDGLSQLLVLDLHSNDLSGPLPSTLGNLSKLVDLGLYYNAFSGTIPPELSNLSALKELKLGHNQLSGSIPVVLGDLTNLEIVGLDDNELTGSIPPQLGNFSKVTILKLNQNKLTGEIPGSFGNFSAITMLWLEENALTGSLPQELGALTTLKRFSVANNALGGAIPSTFTQLSALTDLRLGYNKLTASGSSLIAFLNTKDPDWLQTQTLPVTGLSAAPQSSSSIRLTWTPIAYAGDGGYYEIRVGTAAGGPYAVAGKTTDKSATSFTAGGLTPDTRYYFVVRAFTPAHGVQQTPLWSSYSSEISAETPSDNSSSSPSVTSSPPTIALRGQQYVYSVTASGTAPLSYLLVDNPAGMSINASTGLVEWTPAATGTFPVKIRVTNALGQDEQSFSLVVQAAPEFLTNPLTQGQSNSPYSYDADAEGVPAPSYSLQLAPAGMTVNESSGLIAWTPTATGQYSVTLRAANSNGAALQSYVVNVQNLPTQAPTIISSPVTTAFAGSSYSYDVEATGVPAPTYSLSQAPADMTINSTTGAIAWTPNAPGSQEIVVLVENAQGDDEQSYTLVISDAPDGDGYENDNSCAAARTISSNGASQAHTFHDVQDRDWIKFTALAGRTYIIDVDNVGSKADATIELYDTCETAPAADGNNAFGSSVRLEWDAVKNGDYYIKLQQLDPSFAGADTDYVVSVAVDNVPPSVPKSPRCKPINATTLGIQWKKNPERDVRGYRIGFTGSVSGSEDVEGADTTYYELSDLSPGQLTNFRVQAVDFSGNESDRSGLVECTPTDDVETTKPSILLSQPGGSGIRTTSGGKLTFTGSANDPGANLSRIHVKNNKTGSEGWDYSLTGSSAAFRVEDIDVAVGDNAVRVTAYDDAGNQSVEEYTVRRLGESQGGVIIVAGHNETFSLQTNIYNSANRAYRIFKSAGYTDDDIYYIAPVAQDADADGTNDVDAAASPAAVEDAFLTWGAAGGRLGAGKPLFVYFMDHGFADKFCVSGCDAAGSVSPQQVDGWLRSLESSTGLSDVTVLIEACQSGSFLDRHNGDVANSLSKQGRVIITSTGRENNAYASAQGAYFSDAFFSCVADSNDLKTCYDQATQAVSVTGVDQTPWMDDNGDGLYNASDGTIAKNRVVTRFFSSVRPVLKSVAVERSGVNGLLTAEVEDGVEATDIVWAVVLPPGFAEPENVTLNLNAPTVRLEPDPDTPGRYSFQYVNGFTEDGDYRIVFYAQDRLGIHAVPRRPGEFQNVYLPVIRAP